MAEENKAEDSNKNKDAERKIAEELNETAGGEQDASLDDASDIEKKLETKTQEAADYLETLQMLKADFENYKKRMMKEQANFAQMANEGLILKVLPVLDNFERALYLSEELKQHQNIFKGFEMIYGELLEVLEKEGVKEVSISGEFNPSIHEAVMQVDEKGFSENQVVDVLRKGYMYKDRLIRPAMVKVQRSG